MKKISKNVKKKTDLIVTIVTMVLLVLIVGISYAVYQKEEEVTFINARVGDFRVNLSNITSTSTNNSVDLSYTASGYNASTTCTFGIVKGTYNIGATTVNNSKCTKTGLTQNTTYYYKVCTKNNLKQEVCKEGSINTKYNPPTLSNITATSTTNAIDLSYTESGTVTSRSCKYSTTNGSYTINGNSQTNTKCSITELTSGVTYYYKICISNNGGENCKTGNTATKLNPPTLSNITATSTYNSIDLSYTMSGTVSSKTCKYGTSTSYGSTSNNVTNTKCSITGLKENTTYYYQVCGSNSGGQNCKTGSIKTGIRLSSLVEIGDYISMTPTSTSYTISKDITGYDYIQTINPSELNLWRVIKKNDDGTVDIVSEKISNEKIYFSGSKGYMNLVGGLNQIAASYTNSKYVSKTRHMGYSNQTEFCISFDSCQSDTGEENDKTLVLQATKKLEISQIYWLSSRSYSSSTLFGTTWFGKRIYEKNLYVPDTNLCEKEGSVIVENSQGASIRPILTLKSTIKIKSGDGKTSATAYRFN